MRILAINDISCVGKCSLTVAMPIISACGATCDILPTALLSTHTGGFTGYTFNDLTNEMKKIIAHWETLGLKYDYIYSGYLGSTEQIGIVSYIKDKFLAKGGKFIVDPVMGDNGKLYPNFDAAYAKQMRILCESADYILPNLTEASFLAEKEYPQDCTKKNVRELIENLSSSHTCPILTGIVEGEEIAVYYLEKGEIKRYASHYVEGSFHGSGDVFASAFCGALGYGKNVDTAIALSAEFTTAAISRTAKLTTTQERKYGLFFEQEIYPFLQNLHK